MSVILDITVAECALASFEVDCVVARMDSIERALRVIVAALVVLPCIIIANVSVVNIGKVDDG